MPTGLNWGVDMLAVGLSVAASLVFAIASNLQRSAASNVPISDGGAVRLFLRLLRNRRWLLGSLAALGGLALHTVALRHGGVILVQAILAAGLVAALAVEAATEHRWLSSGELWGSLLCVAGVALVLGLGRPSEGNPIDVTIQSVCGAVLVVVAGLGFVMSRLHHRVSLTAVVMGAVAGTCFAIDAVFLKGLANWAHGEARLAVVVNLTGFVIASTCGNIIVQRAYQRAPLRLVLPAVTVGDPLAAFAIGRGLLGEHLQGGQWANLAVAAGLTAMTIGIVITATHNPHQDEIGESTLVDAVGESAGVIRAVSLKTPATDDPRP